MRKLVESTFMSLDGVISDPQTYGPPYWDDDHLGYSTQLMANADALLLGRVTYEGFAQAWPERSGDEFTDKMNSMPKYVVSTTLTETTWNATVLEGDPAEAVADLKQQPGEGLLKYGTGRLDKTLIEHNLLDELHLWVFPVIVGSGQHMFEGVDGIDMTHLELLDTTTFGSGIVVHVLGAK